MACGEELESPGIGYYYSQECKKCNKFNVSVYWYGYDVNIDDKFFHFDESGYGNRESQQALEEYLKQRSEQNGQ
jgi:hypothetical protein